MKNQVKLLLETSSFDGEYAGLVKDADTTDLEEAVSIMKQMPAGQFMRRLACEAELRQRVSTASDVTTQTLEQLAYKRSDKNAADITSSDTETLPLNADEAGEEQEIKDSETADNIINFPDDFVPIDVSDTPWDGPSSPVSLAESLSNDTAEDSEDKTLHSVLGNQPSNNASEEKYVKNTELTVKTEVSNDADSSVSGKEAIGALEDDPEGNVKSPEEERVYTLEEVNKKIEEEREKYPDNSSQLVLNAVYDEAERNEAFRRCIMQEHKSYGNAISYMAKLCQDGKAGHKFNNSAILDGDTAIELVIGYYWIDDRAEYEQKKKTKEKARINAEKSKAEAAAKKKQKTRKSKAKDDAKEEFLQAVSSGQEGSQTVSDSAKETVKEPEQLSFCFS